MQRIAQGSRAFCRLRWLSSSPSQPGKFKSLPSGRAQRRLRCNRSVLVPLVCYGTPIAVAASLPEPHNIRRVGCYERPATELTSRRMLVGSTFNRTSRLLLVAANTLALTSLRLAVLAQRSLWAETWEPISFSPLLFILIETTRGISRQARLRHTVRESVKPR